MISKGLYNIRGPLDVLTAVELTYIALPTACVLLSWAIARIGWQIRTTGILTGLLQPCRAAYILDIQE